MNRRGLSGTLRLPFAWGPSAEIYGLGGRPGGVPSPAIVASATLRATTG